MKIRSKNVFITGANRGIGLALAQALKEKGAHIIAGVRQTANTDALLKAIPDAYLLPIDVSQNTSIDNALLQLKNDKVEVDILVNNAGIMRELNFVDQLDSSEIDAEIATNLLGPIDLTYKLSAELQKRPEAAIVNVSSGVGILPIPRYPVYSATKAALHSFTTSLRYQLRKTNVRVIEVLPPVVNTTMTTSLSDEGKSNMMTPEKFAKALVKEMEKGKTTIPLGASKSLLMLHRVIPGFIQNSLNKY